MVPIQTQRKTILTGRKYVIILVALAFTAGALAGCVDSDPSSGDPDDPTDPGQQGDTEDGGQDETTHSGVGLGLMTLASGTDENQWTIQVLTTTKTVAVDLFAFTFKSEVVGDSSEWLHDGYPVGDLNATGAYFDLEAPDQTPLCYRMTHVDVDEDARLAAGDHLVLHVVEGSWCMDTEDADFDGPGSISGELELEFLYRPAGGASSGSISRSF